jgi:hypothetical protein
MVLAPFVNYNMDAIFPFCAEAAQERSNAKLQISEILASKHPREHLAELELQTK